MEDGCVIVLELVVVVDFVEGAVEGVALGALDALECEEGYEPVGEDVCGEGQEDVAECSGVEVCPAKDLVFECHANGEGYEFFVGLLVEFVFEAVDGGDEGVELVLGVDVLECLAVE